MDKVRVLQVIETTLTRRGNGTDDPIRVITEYWDMDGNKLAEVDPLDCSICGDRNCTSSHK